MSEPLAALFSQFVKERILRLSVRKLKPGTGLPGRHVKPHRAAIPVARILDSFKPANFYEWRIYAIVMLLLDTGSRIDEVLGLASDAVDLEGLCVRVRGKGSLRA